MANRDNHYEAAFEAWLRARQIPYVAVDETRRSLLGDGSLKSLDFIVSPTQPPHLCAADYATGVSSWLIDVKGRLFPGGRQKQYWKNWSTQDDLWSLACWQQLFGQRFDALFAFAYWITTDKAPLPRQQLFSFRSRWYGFIGIRLSDYVRHARPVSGKWETVAMSTQRFRELAAPIEDFLVRPDSAPPAPVAAMLSGGLATSVESGTEKV